MSNTFAETIYTIISQDLTFALAVGGSKTLCGYNIIKTEHPKLFILEGQKERFFNSPAPPRTHDMDLFAYVNSKFIYVEKHVKTQVTNLYRDILLHRCAL
ncbi:hypothetical protein, partial [Enterobacter cloacae complex sp. 4DZ3-17B2]|uniref:hypothetical protein n=1 Tax=Enterobacter cloacae complex sp. 4DZ3-17B2 TaxID=2511990 RepID=UPI001CA4F7E4